MPPALLYAIGVLIFAFGLLASIALHEVGHLVPAKKFGVKVTQYMVGFGPTVWSRKRGETEYGVKAIPLGGYIRMIGMVPPRLSGKPSRWPRRLATAIEDYRQVSRAEIDPADRDREFYRLTPGKKMIVMLGGPCMNLIIFFVLMTILFLSLGTSHDDTTTTVGAIEKCVVPAGSTDVQSGSCAGHAPTPALAAGLKPGDHFVSINGVATKSWTDVLDQIQPNAGVALPVVVARTVNGHTSDVALTMTPVKNLNYVGDTDKKAVVGFIGFEPRQHYYYQRLSVTAVPGQIGHQLKLGVDTLGKYPSRVADTWGTVFENKPRSINSAVGVVGIGRISGDYAKSDLLTVQDKVFTLIALLASVNLLLFFFNLLPLLPLDGGHVLGALIEAARRGRARLRARRGVGSVAGEPVPAEPTDLGNRPAHKQIFVDTAQSLPFVYGVASLLAVLMLLTLYADIVHPINPLGG